jgi:tRNA modification GTPase
MPAVGIAGAPNAGKSSLLNKLLGKKRSIVSSVRKTTRDVLTGLYEMDRCRCVLFDCAGLVERPKNILDELAQSAAIEALQTSSVVVFCVDVSKDSWQEDIAIRELISPEVLICVATKSDLLSGAELTERVKKLNKLFDSEFLTTSIKTNIGLSRLRDTIDKKIIELYSRVRSRRTDEPLRAEVSEDVVALTARHKQSVTDSIECIGEAAKEVKAGNDEIAAMLLRTAVDVLSDIEHQHIDEQVLENIFSRFCIGK